MGSSPISATNLSQSVGMRPVGQAVKTRPFHGCNMGSIPVRVTKASGFPEAFSFGCHITGLLHFEFGWCRRISARTLLMFRCQLLYTDANKRTRAIIALTKNARVCLLNQPPLNARKPFVSVACDLSSILGKH